MLAPCPTLYQRRNRLGDGVETLRHYKEKSVIQNGANTAGVGLGFQSEIVVGEFVERQRPSLREEYDARMRAVLKDAYVPYEGTR